MSMAEFIFLQSFNGIGNTISARRRTTVIVGLCLLSRTFHSIRYYHFHAHTQNKCTASEHCHNQLIAKDKYIECTALIVLTIDSLFCIWIDTDGRTTSVRIISRFSKLYAHFGQEVCICFVLLFSVGQTWLWRFNALRDLFVADIFCGSNKYRNVCTRTLIHPFFLDTAIYEIE